MDFAVNNSVGNLSSYLSLETPTKGSPPVHSDGINSPESLPEVERVPSGNKELGSFLGRAFFMFDDAWQDEMAEQDDLLLFFFPMDVSIDKKLFLLGGCSAMVSFSKTFSQPSNSTSLASSSSANSLGNIADVNKPDELVIRMDKFKFAVKEECGAHMILSGESSDTDSTILEVLNLVWNAFRFFNGSFQELKEVVNSTRVF